MISERPDVFAYIFDHCMRYGDFTLSSGKKTNRYFNLRAMALDADIARQLFLEFNKMIFKHKLYGHKSIGGLEVGAIPLITFLTHEFKSRGFYVRKQVKDHGLRTEIEGFPMSPYFIVDDVVTTGRSIFKVEEILKRYYPNGETVGRMCIIDRRPKDLIKKQPKIYSVFKESDFD